MSHFKQEYNHGCLVAKTNALRKRKERLARIFGNLKHCASCSEHQLKETAKRARSIGDVPKHIAYCTPVGYVMPVIAALPQRQHSHHKPCFSQVERVERTLPNQLIKYHSADSTHYGRFNYYIFNGQNRMSIPASAIVLRKENAPACGRDDIFGLVPSYATPNEVENRDLYPHYTRAVENEIINTSSQHFLPESPTQAIMSSVAISMDGFETDPENLGTPLSLNSGQLDEKVPDVSSISSILEDNANASNLNSIDLQELLENCNGNLLENCNGNLLENCNGNLLENCNATYMEPEIQQELLRESSDSRLQQQDNMTERAVCFSADQHSSTFHGICQRPDVSEQILSINRYTGLQLQERGRKRRILHNETCIKLCAAAELSDQHNVTVSKYVSEVTDVTVSKYVSEVTDVTVSKYVSEVSHMINSLKVMNIDDAGKN